MSKLTLKRALFDQLSCNSLSLHRRYTMAVLTSGAILGIYRNEVTSGADGPLLQVIDIRPIKSGTGTSQQRYRLILSDGDAYQQAMLATQKNDHVAPVFRDG